MDKFETDAVRASIIAEYTARIEKLKEDMNTELAALARVEQRLKDLAGKQKSPIIIVSTGDKQAAKTAKAPRGRERIIATKSILSGRFPRKDLHAAVNNDGYGEMKIGTFSPYVSEMIGKEIIEVQKAIGNEPAVYMWADESEKMKV